MSNHKNRKLTDAEFAKMTQIIRETTKKLDVKSPTDMFKKLHGISPVNTEILRTVRDSLAHVNLSKLDKLVLNNEIFKTLKINLDTVSLSQHQRAELLKSIQTLYDMHNLIHDGIKKLSPEQYSHSINVASEQMHVVINARLQTPVENAKEIVKALHNETDVDMALEIANAAVGELEDLLVAFKMVDSLRNVTKE